MNPNFNLVFIALLASASAPALINARPIESTHFGRDEAALTGQLEASADNVLPLPIDLDIDGLGLDGITGTVEDAVKGIKDGVLAIVPAGLLGLDLKKGVVGGVSKTVDSLLDSLLGASRPSRKYRNKKKEDDKKDGGVLGGLGLDGIL
ncbi:hypothetical protein CVT24_008460 [Panaeolus cyanescens]|uniref:Uncharacterized protein n=1 Tax=Panaeolus cyanescens TaxID=181874 RepID=A0A409VC06_9AGAR|nr:hypothetical protein CVT24_008460 [Panaeolus cyanescens]